MFINKQNLNKDRANIIITVDLFGQDYLEAKNRISITVE